MKECRKKRWIRLNREKHNANVRAYKARKRAERAVYGLLNARWAA